MDESSDFPHPPPKISGFTPINHRRYSDTGPLDLGSDNAATKPRACKRRKTQPSTAAAVSKLKKAAGSKKIKKSRTAAQLGCQNISQGLPKTKPTPSGDGALCAKAGLSVGDVSLQNNSKLRRIGDTPLELEVKQVFNGRKKQSDPSGLADKYQAACSNVQGNVANQATPLTPPMNDQIEARRYHNDDPYGQESAKERYASPNVCVEPSVQKPRESGGSIIVRDYGAPPFTQMSSPIFRDSDCREDRMVGELDPLDSISDDLFEVGNIKDGDHGGDDEFPMDDECLEEMMHTMMIPAEEEPFGLAQDFSDDTLYIDEQPENDQSHCPGAISGSNGVVIYDEDPTFATSHVIDVPSSPLWSSQVSCILTHVTGNAIPDRARSSQGSENCFNDNDLDDGLIDHFVDESRSLQVTSPMTPAKRPLSPKLQWLPPKIYTPMNPSQISVVPVSPTNDQLVASVDPNGDVLPFIRPPFPKAVRDRSPILGLSNRTVLRICFRIGEALNAAAVASRTKVDAIIELYARVVTSSREPNGTHKQVFKFGDLFTDKPPHLSGTYNLWKGVELWDNDSKELVGNQGRGKMVRVLGRIKRKEPVQGQRPGVDMIVLSIWEVDWEDVEVAKGIVCPKGG